MKIAQQMNKVQMKKKIIAYLRCSTDHQDLQHQKNSIYQYANKNNLSIDEFIEDFGISAYKTSYTERDGLQQVLNMAHDGLIDTLIIFESSRLSRNHLQGQIVIDELTRCNVIIHSVTEGVVNKNEIDALMNSIRFFTNQLESKKISERIQSSMNKRRLDNKHLGGHTPIGYKKNGDKLEVDENMREIIINTYKTYIHYGTNKTIEYLASVGIKKPRRSVVNLIKNTIYKGYPYKNKDTDIYVKELDIVSEELWNEANEVLKNRRTKKDSNVYHNKSDSILEGMIYHSCNNKMYINYNQYKVASYRCEECIINKSNVQKSYVARKLETVVDSKISSFFDTLDSNELEKRFNESRNEELIQLNKDLIRYNGILAIKHQAIDNANKKLEQLFLQDASIDIIQVVTDSINQLKNSIANLEESINEIKKKIANDEEINKHQIKLSKQLLDFKYLYTKATIEQKKVILHQIIDKIIINSWDDIEIIYNHI